MRILHKELGYAINGCVYDVYNALKPGYDEEIYHIAMSERLAEMGIPFQSEVTKYIVHRECKVHKFKADLIIDDKILVELKNIQSDFIPQNFLQIISYLKCWQKDIGILANFGQSSAAIKRVLYNPQKAKINENYDAILGLIPNSDKSILRELRIAILTILKVHGLGYDENVYKSILQAELDYQKMPFLPKISIPVCFYEKIIKEYEIKYPLIANKIICGISAVKDDISIDIAKVKTYLNALELPYGLLIHFGKKELKILGISY